MNLGSLLDKLMQGLGISSNEFTDLVTVFEEGECGHSTDSDLLCYIALIVDINLVKLDASDLLGELLEHGGYDSAGTTPGRPKVKDAVFVFVDYFLESREGGDWDDRHDGERGYWVLVR